MVCCQSSGNLLFFSCSFFFSPASKNGKFVFEDEGSFLLRMPVRKELFSVFCFLSSFTVLIIAHTHLQCFVLEFRFRKTHSDHLLLTQTKLGS